VLGAPMVHIVTSQLQVIISIQLLQQQQLKE